MQRYRVNYRVLGALAAGGVVTAGALYGLWKFQVDRNAGTLLERAERAKSQQDYVSAIEHLTQFVRLKRDETTGWIALGQTAAEALERPGSGQDEATPLAYRALFEAVPRTNDPDLRRSLLEFQLQGGAPLDALKNVRELLPPEFTKGNDPAKRLAACREFAAASPENSELFVLEVRCMLAAGQQQEAENRCLELVGYDPQEQTIDVERALTPEAPEVYSILASQLILQDRLPSLVEQLVAHLADRQTTSAKAALELHQVLLMLKREDEARAALAEAAKLAPDDADVLFRLGLQAQDDYTKAIDEEPAEDLFSDMPSMEAEVLRLLREDLADRTQEADLSPLQEALAANQPIGPALRALDLPQMSQGSLKRVLEPLEAYYDAVANQDAEFARRKLVEARAQLRAAASLDQALGYFTEGMTKYPDKILFHDRAARIHWARGDLQAALEIVDAALKSFGLERAISMTQFKFDLLFAMNDYEGVRKEAGALAKLPYPLAQALADFQLARLEAVQERWFDAASKLRQVRLRLASVPDQQALAASIEGFCQERLGRFDLARKAYEDSLKIRRSPQAEAGLERAVAQLAPADTPATQQASQFDLLVEQELAKPESQQNWEKVFAQIDELVKQNDLPETRSLLYRAQVLVQRAQRSEDASRRRDLYAQAREVITRAYRLDKTDRTVIPAAIRLLALEPDTGPARALEYYNRVLPDFGDDPSMRRLLADLLVANNSEQLPAQLMGVTQNMDDWTPKQQSVVWQSVAAHFNRLNMLDEARDCLIRALELDPSTLPTAMLLFDVAMQKQDSAAMDLAQDRVREIVGGESAPEYVLTEVKRRLVGLSQGTVSREEANAGRAMLDRAIAQRPTWHELYVLRGQFAAMLDQDPQTALENFALAAQYGRANLNAVVLQVQLLADLGRFAEAATAMSRIPPEMRAPLLRKVGPQILLETGKTEAARELAVEVAEADPRAAATQVWLGEMGLRLNDAQLAETAFRKALELNPTDPTVWSRLVGLHIQTKEPEKLLQVLREAHLALDAEFLPPLTAKYYELYGRWDAAEDIYLSLYGNRADDAPSARKLAEFYRTWTLRGDKPASAAAPYLNRILRAIDAGTLSADHPDAVWARQQAAEILAATGDYQDSLKAEQLLTTGAGNAQAQAQDQAMLAALLGKREDPESHLKAVALLKRIRQERGSLSPQQGISLGQLLYRVGEWKECRSQMEFSISQHPDDVNLRSSYIAMLIEQRDFAEAERWIARLESIPEARGIAIEYQVRLAARRGDLDAVRRLLNSIAPRLGSNPSEQQLNKVLQVARLAMSVRDYPTAVDRFADLARHTDAFALEVASAIGQHGDLDQGLDTLQRYFPKNMDEVLRLAVAVYRQRREEAPEKLDALLEQMSAAALRDDPESAVRLELRAETLEIAGKHDDAIAAYDLLLARDDVPPMLRASALNNLAYLLALAGKQERLPDALAAAEEAARILGPLSDILDTRAVIRMAMGQPELAVADMQLATRVGATPSKYFHYAKAQLLAGQQDAAVATWRKGLAEGLSADSVNSLERSSYQEIAAQIEPLLGS